MDIQLNQEVLDGLMAIKTKKREDLTKEEGLIFKAAYKDITGRYPQSGCSGTICRGIYIIVHNYLNKLEKHPAKAVVIEKVVSEKVAKYDLSTKPLAELKALARDKGIEFAKNAGTAKMIEILKAAE
jgi:hypothetical protein